MTENKYANWSTYETWAANNGIGNLEFEHAYWHLIAQGCWDVAKATDQWTRRESAAFQLAGRLKNEINNAKKCRLLDEKTFYADILREGMSRVNWDEIAFHLLEDIAADEEIV